MINAGPRLRDLMARASPAQNARAAERARFHRALCVREGIEPANAQTFLIEALELELKGEADDPLPSDEARARLEIYNGRDYAGSYSES